MSVNSVRGLLIREPITERHKSRFASIPQSILECLKLKSKIVMIVNKCQQTQRKRSTVHGCAFALERFQLVKHPTQSSHVVSKE